MIVGIAVIKKEVQQELIKYKIETPEDLDKVKEDYIKLRDQGKDIKLVSCTHPFTKPENFKPRRKKELYCPYCGGSRRFKIYGHLPVKRCTVCGISINHKSVKDSNNLWGR